MPLPPDVECSLDSGSKGGTDNGNGNGNGNDVRNSGLVKITDPDVKVTLPILKYGYRTTRASWEELVRTIEVEYDIPKLARSRAQQHDYEVFRYHMKRQYRSTLDYMLISKFGFDAVAVDDGNRRQRWKTARPRSEGAPGDLRRVILVENDFPYFVEESIVHYVLWKLDEEITPREISEARERLQSEPVKALELLQWVNPPYLKSIPEIDHVHFLCRLEPTGKS
mmetsp:Transcript_4049/g.10574  ORF Transcript_4049/g.10574 Transcript_4049/m.10574 type:complete len:224 (-) Transcript_4049:143-814(-)